MRTEVTVSSCHCFPLRKRSPCAAAAWDPSYRRQFSINFSNMGPSHGLWFFTSCSSVGYLPWGQSFRNCFKVSPLSGHKSCQEPCSSLHRPTGPSRTWSNMGLFHRLQVDLCFPPADLHALQEDNLPHYALHHGLQENLSSSSWNTSSLSFLADFGVCGAISLTYSQSSLLWLEWLLPNNFSF